MNLGAGIVFFRSASRARPFLAQFDTVSSLSQLRILTTAFFCMGVLILPNLIWNYRAQTTHATMNAASGLEAQVSLGAMVRDPHLFPPRPFHHWSLTKWHNYADVS